MCADVCGFLKPLDSDGSGKFVSMVHPPFLTKLLASARPIRAAITRYGSTRILLNGAAFNHIAIDTIDDSS